MKKSLETPITNRGVETTLYNTLNNDKTYINKGKINNLGQYILFDWLQFTILEESLSYFDNNGCLCGYKDYKDFAVYLFDLFFNVPYSDLYFEYKGINGYNCCFSYKDIYCYWHTNRTDMGIHFKLSGQGCRDFESLGLDYVELFNKIYKYSFNFNRIDISIDDFSNTYFNLPLLLKYCRKGAVSSKFKSSLNIEKLCLSSNNTLGHTLQFGSKASNIQVTFYDKFKERESQGFIIDKHISFWVRTEVRFRHEKANLIAFTLSKNFDSINTIIKSILRDYIDFKDFSFSDTNLCRRPTALFWNKFLENVDKLKLTNYLPESSITKKANWISDSVSKSNLMVFISNLDNLCLDEFTSEYLLKLLKTGIHKFNYKDLVLVNDYRIANKMQPFTFNEIKDYVNDIKEVALLVDKKQ